MALSAAQKKARARFTKAAKKAKQLRKANPKLSQAEAIKKAFALDKKPAKKVGAVTLKKANRFKGDDRLVVYNDGKPHLDGRALSKTDAKIVADALRKVKAKRKIAARKISGVATKSRTHTDKNKFTVNMQLGAIRGGSKFILYKGMQIEKKPVQIGKKRGFVYISGGMTWSTLKDAKRYILHLSK